MIAPILAAVAESFGCQVADLTGPDRARHVTRARQAAAWLLRQAVPGISLETIGAALQRDHTTILYALAVVPVYRATDPTYNHLLTTLEARYVHP